MYILFLFLTVKNYGCSLKFLASLKSLWSPLHDTVYNLNKKEKEKFVCVLSVHLHDNSVFRDLRMQKFWNWVSKCRFLMSCCRWVWLNCVEIGIVITELKSIKRHFFSFSVLTVTQINFQVDRTMSDSLSNLAFHSFCVPQHAELNWTFWPNLNYSMVALVNNNFN